MNPNTLEYNSLYCMVNQTLQIVSVIECEEKRLMTRKKINSLNCIVDHKLWIDEEYYEERCLVKKKIKIKRHLNCIKFHHNTKLMIAEARDYLMNIPLPLINEYVELVLKKFTTDYGKYYPDFYHQYAILLNIIPLSKVSTYCDKWINEHLLRRIGKKLMFKNLAGCSRLENLSLCEVLVSKMEIINFSQMLNKLIHLTTLKIIPTDLSPIDEIPFNIVIRLVTRCCPELRELHLVYDGESLKNTKSKIEDLVKCRNLVSLWLYDNSSTTTVENIDGLQKLLIELKNLKCLFHKDLKSAILDPNEKISGTLGLEHLILRNDLFHYRDYKVALTTDELLRLIKTCPATRTLKLIKPPPCIDTVARAIPNLEILDMSICGDVIPLGLSRSLLQNNFKNLKVLKLEKAFNINYTHISQLAHCCPHLEVLDISFATIKADGNLTLPPRQFSAFPHLKELTMVPICDTIGLHSCTDRGCEYRMWEVGKDLMQYLLKGSYKLKSLHIHYNGSYYSPSSTVILEMLKSLKCLTSIQLVSLLDMPWEIIHQIITSCPMLNKLVAFGRWIYRLDIIYRLPERIEFKQYCDCLSID
uniref:Uncharacterized protein n=1 Tax=Melicertus latisulcatus majanivirus TaxID=2984277 RepID=A0A9C7BHU2_9VIRU|nr:MAG: hypothetical protein [Melicertus latisulcatus majanivirus]